MLTVNDVANHLRVSRDTVERLIRSGDLAAIKSNTGRLRIDPAALTAYESTWKPAVPPGADSAA